MWASHAGPPTLSEISTRGLGAVRSRCRGFAPKNLFENLLERAPAAAQGRSRAPSPRGQEVIEIGPLQSRPEVETLPVPLTATKLEIELLLAEVRSDTMDLSYKSVVKDRICRLEAFPASLIFLELLVLGLFPGPLPFPHSCCSSYSSGQRSPGLGCPTVLKYPQFVPVGGGEKNSALVMVMVMANRPGQSGLCLGHLCSSS